MTQPGSSGLVDREGLGPSVVSAVDKWTHWVNSGKYKTYPRVYKKLIVREMIGIETILLNHQMSSDCISLVFGYHKPRKRRPQQPP